MPRCDGGSPGDRREMLVSPRAGSLGWIDAHASGVASAVGNVADLGACSVAAPVALGEPAPDPTLPLTEHEASAKRPSAKSASAICRRPRAAAPDAGRGHQSATIVWVAFQG